MKNAIFEAILEQKICSILYPIDRVEVLFNKLIHKCEFVSKKLDALVAQVKGSSRTANTQ